MQRNNLVDILRFPIFLLIASFARLFGSMILVVSSTSSSATSDDDVSVAAVTAVGAVGGGAAPPTWRGRASTGGSNKRSEDRVAAFIFSKCDVYKLYLSKVARAHFFLSSIVVQAEKI